MKTRWTLLAAAVAMALPVAARADHDIALEYHFARIQEVSTGGGTSKIELNMPVGGAVTLGTDLSDMIGIAINGSYNRKTETESFTSGGVTTTGETKFDMMAAHGGLRLNLGHGGVVPRVNLLVGATRLHTQGALSITAGGAVFSDTADQSETNFSIQPGFSVDFGGDSLRFRVGGDYRVVFSEGDKLKVLIAHAGIVF